MIKNVHMNKYLILNGYRDEFGALLPQCLKYTEYGGIIQGDSRGRITVSVIVSKNVHMNKCLILNGYRDGFGALLPQRLKQTE